MFPTVDNHYQQRNRRRGRNDLNNRDYICPCGKSYLSYPALFTHIKTKHNGRAPGQIIKPTSQNSRRGRPKAREIFDSESQTQDIASNSLDRLCDFVLSSQIQRPQQSSRFKQIYMKDPFYEVYASYNQQQQEERYNQVEDIYEQTCENVFSEFLAEVQKRLNEPFYVDLLFLFIVMIVRGVNRSYAQKASMKDQQENNNNRQQNSQSLENVRQLPIQKISDYANDFLTIVLPKFREQQKLEDVFLFSDKTMGKLLQFFFNWLTQKKYLAVKIRMNQVYFRA